MHGCFGHTAILHRDMTFYLRKILSRMDGSFPAVLQYTGLISGYFCRDLP